MKGTVMPYLIALVAMALVTVGFTQPMKGEARNETQVYECTTDADCIAMELLLNNDEGTILDDHPEYEAICNPEHYREDWSDYPNLELLCQQEVW